MDGYKIGEVSRVFGIPQETLRYYESRGIITPRRDDESGYRYYGVWDMNYLLDCLWYRSYGFSLADVEHMVNKDDLKTFEERCLTREEEIREHIKKQELILKSLTAHREKLASIGEKTGKFTLADSPELVWQRQREQGIMEKGEGASEIHRWVELLPLVHHTFLMPEVKPVEGEFKDYCWGFSATREEAAALGLDKIAGSEPIASYKSINTVFTAGGEGTFMDAFNAQVIEPIKKLGYTPSRPPVGHLLVRIRENGEMKRYFEVWVPVE